MPHVQVMIAGRSYRMACGEGEERHLESLAASFDAKVSEMRGAFGEIGDMRLQVMAALTLADDLAEAKRRIGSLETEVAGLRTASAAGSERSEQAEQALADSLVRAAERIESLARTLGPA